MMLQVIPIISIPGFGDRAAEKVCTDMKIQSQNDRDKLDEAKKQVYLKGFTEGVLTVGPHTGRKVCLSHTSALCSLCHNPPWILLKRAVVLCQSQSGKQVV